MNNWISVKERLPENGQRCLIANESYAWGVCSGFYFHGMFYDSLGDKTDIDDIVTTHWQPLSPPTEEEDKNKDE